VAPFDGTTGKPCVANSDCKGTSADAPGTNVCSNNYTFPVDTLTVQLWPTPLCLAPLPRGTGNCNATGDGSGLPQFCDSADPTNVNSPGICLPVPALTPPNDGLCLPACTFDLTGAPAVGCPGHDTCVPMTFLLDNTTNTVVGVGFCQGTCQSDDDCTALGTGWGCQTDLGFCTLAKKTRTKAAGAQCTNASATGAATDSSTGACNCFTNLNSTNGYCTSACVVNGTPCANGGVCDSLEPTNLLFQGPTGTVSVAGPPMQNPGLAGTCMQPCTLADAGAPAAGDGGDDAGSSSACPPISSCASGDVAGSDCQPM
jgi:hypothetical protein